jgi:hypothetical protein
LLTVPGMLLKQCRLKPCIQRAARGCRGIVILAFGFLRRTGRVVDEALRAIDWANSSVRSDLGHHQKWFVEPIASGGSCPWRKRAAWLKRPSPVPNSSDGLYGAEFHLEARVGRRAILATKEGLPPSTQAMPNGQDPSSSSFCGILSAGHTSSMATQRAAR